MPTDLTSWNSRLCQETTPRPYTKLLIFLFQRKMCDNNIREVISAANFAAIKHKNQKRSDPEGTPYINHPLGVAHILSQVWRGGGGQSILHLIIRSLKIQIASHSVTNVKENIYFSIPAIRSLLFVIQKPGGNFSKTGAQTDLIKWAVLSGSNYYFNFLFNSYSPQLLYVAMQWNWTECQSVFVKYRIQGLWLRCQRAAVDQMKTKRRK